jgi:hypothetical protein
MPSAVMLPPVKRAREGVEHSLSDYGVGVHNVDESAALHFLEYSRGELVLAVVGFTDELKFLRHPEPAVVALIRAHHALATS